MLDLQKLDFLRIDLLPPLVSNGIGSVFIKPIIANGTLGVFLFIDCIIWGYNDHSDKIVRTIFPNYFNSRAVEHDC